MAEAMGFHGVAYYFPNAKFMFMPTPDMFPIDTRSLAFFAGDQVIFTNVKDDSVLCVDSTAICKISSKDVLTVDVVLDLGKKAVMKRS